MAWVTAILSRKGTRTTTKKKKTLRTKKKNFIVLFKDESNSAYMMVKSLLRTRETRINVHYLNESHTVPTDQSNESLARMLLQKK